jgi:hypothetical protein
MALNSVSQDVRQLLNDNSKGTQGTDLFSFEWGESGGEEIDKQILVIDTQSIDVELKDEYENPTFNIYVRGDSNESKKSVYDRARDIYEFMLTQPTQEINAVEYLQFKDIGGLNALTKDENNRFTYSMNFFTWRCSIEE